MLGFARHGFHPVLEKEAIEVLTMATLPIAHFPTELLAYVPINEVRLSTRQSCHRFFVNLCPIQWCGGVRQIYEECSFLVHIFFLQFFYQISCRDVP